MKREKEEDREYKLDEIWNFFRIGLRRHWKQFKLLKIFLAILVMIIVVITSMISYSIGLRKTGMSRIERAEWYMDNLDMIESFNSIFCSDKIDNYCTTGGSCDTSCSLNENTSIKDAVSFYRKYGFVSRIGLSAVLDDICGR